MNMTKKKVTSAAVLLTALLSAGGCEYMPNEVHEIQTTDGKVLKLMCPTVDQNRSTFTYLIDNECRLVK